MGATAVQTVAHADEAKPYRGLFFISADSTEALKTRLAAELEQMRQGKLPPSVIPFPSDLEKTERLSIDYADEQELIKRAERALKGFDSGS